MKYRNALLTLILLLSMGACSSEDYFSDELTVSTETEITEIVATIDELQYEATGTRTTITMGEFNSNSIQLVWAEKDTIGIYPTEGDQLSFPIVEGIGTNKCTFNGGGWALKSSTSYKAYSPFNRAYYYKKSNGLPISMLGQTQVGNGNSDHLGKYDLQIAKGKTPTSGKISFEFKHQVCFIRMDLKAPVAATWKSVKLESNALFTTEASMDIASETPILTATSTANSVTLDLENVSTQRGEIITAYMTVLPVDFTGKILNVTLINDKGEKFKTNAVIANDYRNFKAGYARWITANDFPTEKPYLTFTADFMQTLTMTKAVESLEYSVNGGAWTTLGTTTVTFGGDYGDLRLRGKSKTGTATGTANDFENYYSTIKFGTNALVDCYGNIRSLIDYTSCGEAYIDNVFTANAKFCYLFKDCTVLKSAPILNFTYLAKSCFYGMFYGCSNLTTPPTLPATNLTSGCYAYMFFKCEKLATAPKLPAKSLTYSPWCYQYMFSHCNSLITTPELPAWELSTECYRNMFAYCKNLTETPKSLAGRLSDGCYHGMFAGCTSLSIAPELPETVLAEGCYYAMFEGCTNLSVAPKLPATALANYCYQEMFNNTALTSAPQLPATTLKTGCYSRMFQGCKNLTTAPELPATKLENVCYEKMFEYCINLKNVTMLATDISAYKSLSNWLSNVSSSGTFTKDKDMTSLPEGSNGIPNGWIVVDSE